MIRLNSILILCLIVIISGCAYKFDSSELEYMEFHEPTNATSWAEGVFDKGYSVDFINGTINGEEFPDSASFAENITAIINEYGMQIGLHKRNESCIKKGWQPGLVILKYKLGTITIEEDFCEDESVPSAVYHRINDLGVG